MPAEMEGGRAMELMVIHTPTRFVQLLDDVVGHVTLRIGTSEVSWRVDLSPDQARALATALLQYAEKSEGK
jgi:hypothetical protein